MVNITGDMTSHICCAINKIVPGQALGAQKIRGIWIIAVHTPQARASLLQSSTITVNKKQVKLSDNNPYDLKAKRVEGERVVFKDLPLWESDTLIKDYLRSLEQVGEFSEVFSSKARDHNTNEATLFWNGDRYVFIKIDPAQPIPSKCVLGGYQCRIRYPTQQIKCKRCSLYGHKADSSACKLFIESPQDNFILFRNGIYSNFSPAPVVMGSTTFPTSEHAYQWRACSEHLRDDLAEKVVNAKSPKDAKQIASEVKIPGSWWDNAKYDIMREVLIAKIGSNKFFRDELLNSGDKNLVEALADPWWGCGLPYHIAIKTNPKHYPGSNKLGQLLMELRGDMQADHSAHPLIEHIGHDCVESPERQRSIKKMCSKVRSSSVPVHTKEKYQKTVSTPLIKDMFRRQSTKRQRVTSPTPNPEDHVSKDETTSCVSTTYTLGDKSAHGILRDVIENR